MSTPTVNLWVKAEPFTYGALSVAPHPRLSFHNIKKIVPYAKTKSKAGYPRLNYSVWKHIACNKLQLPEELAWMYFTSFASVNEAIANTEHIEWDNKLACCSKQTDAEHLKNSFNVPTLQFVLFLFVQHLHKISLRASLLSGSDEWPLRARSPDLECGRATPTGAKSLDEHGHMTFILNHLNEIMELLVESDPYSVSGDSTEQSLSMEALQALSFIITGSTDRNKTIMPLHEIALQQQVQQKTGFSKISHSFSFRSLQSWLRSHISQNPFGISSCIQQGRRLSWPLAGADKDVRENKRGRIATNALYVPKDSLKGNKIIILSQVGKQTVARCSGTLEGSSVKIHRCHYSSIYLLSPLRSVSIEKCRHSTIILGPVESTVHINNCEQVTVIAPTRRISVSGSTLCVLHLLTPLRPLLLSGNESIILAPYHTHYARLEEHMYKAGISAQPNNWDKPLCIGPDHQDDAPVWEIMNPREFYLFTVPFEIGGHTKCVPGGLPRDYQRALLQRDRQIETWQQMVKTSGLSKEQAKTFQGIVEQRFQEWLVDTGNKRQLDGLVVPIKKLP